MLQTTMSDTLIKPNVLLVQEDRQSQLVLDPEKTLEQAWAKTGLSSEQAWAAGTGLPSEQAWVAETGLPSEPAWAAETGLPSEQATELQQEWVEAKLPSGHMQAELPAGADVNVCAVLRAGLLCPQGKSFCSGLIGRQADAKGILGAAVGT